MTNSIVTVERGAFLEAAILKVKPEDRFLIEDLYALTKAISQQGYPCRATTEDSLNKLSQLSEDRKDLIRRHLQTTLQIVKTGTRISMHHVESENEHAEMGMVEKALEIFGLEVKDPFWQEVDRNDFIEIYSADHVQIFRTLNFFKLSSYSLLDLLANEWYVLWERPKVIVEKIFEVVTKVLSGESQGLVPMNIPVHILREIYQPADPLAASTTRSSLVRNKFVCPVYHQGTSQIAGMIVSSEAKNIGSGEEVEKLAFL